MNSELFRAARDYHGAIAAYCRAMHAVEHPGNFENIEDLEHLAQEVLGASLRYRRLLDQLIAGASGGSSEERVGRRRLTALRKLLKFTSLRYNALAKLHRLHP